MISNEEPEVADVSFMYVSGTVSRHMEIYFFTLNSNYLGGIL